MAGVEESPNTTEKGEKGQPPSLLLLPKISDIRYKGPAKGMTYLWWTLFIANVLGYLLFVVKIGNALYSQFAYTVDLPTGQPGTLLSTRFSFYYWLLILPLSFEAAMFILGAVRIGIPWDNAYGVMHTIVATFVTVLEFAAAIGILVIGNNANTLSDPLNPARSLYFCAVNSYPNNQALTPQGCPTPTVAYPVVTTDLGWNGVFTNNFGFTWGMFVIALIEMIVGILMSMRFTQTFEEGNVDVYLDDMSGPIEGYPTNSPEPIMHNKKETTSEVNQALLKMDAPIGTQINKPPNSQQQVKKVTRYVKPMVFNKKQ